MKLNQPVVAGFKSKGGAGYYLVAADGGVFAFGDAEFHGARPPEPLDQPIIDGFLSAGGDGYVLIATDGGVFTYGDAQFHGSVPGLPES